jgi:hypothetical protein
VTRDVHTSEDRTLTWVFPVSSPPCLPDQSGWQSSAALADENPLPWRQRRHAETVAKAAARAFDRGRIPWNLDAAPRRYCLMTT